MGVFGSRLNTVFLVPTFGCFQFPFFFWPFLFVMGTSASVPFLSWVFSVAPPPLLLLLLLLVSVVLDFVDGTGAGGVGAVRGGNLKK